MRKVRGKFHIIETNTLSVFWKNGVGIKSQDTSGGTVGSLTGAVAIAGSADKEVPWVVIESTSSNQSVLKGLADGTDQKAGFKSSGYSSGP